jgi:hypothetical protein
MSYYETRVGPRSEREEIRYSMTERNRVGCLEKEGGGKREIKDDSYSMSHLTENHYE